MRILSIDFDYFINAGIAMRNGIFPDAEDLSYKECMHTWKYVYEKHPEVRRVGIKGILFSKVFEFLRTHPKCKVLCSMSHKDIYDFITPLEENVKLVNIDFHHDFYAMYGSQVTCANWLMKLAEEHQFKQNDVTWVCREDSEKESLFGSFPYYVTLDLNEVLKGQYDYIFLCLSPEWTPPHLINKYHELQRVLEKK